MVLKGILIVAGYSRIVRIRAVVFCYRRWLLFARVDESVCQQVVATLKDFAIPKDTEDTSIEGLSPNQTCDFYLMLVGICHQTQSLMGTCSGEPKRGWDYLRLKLLNAALEAPGLLNVGAWGTFDEDRLQEIMHDDEEGNTLSDVSGRVALVQDLGNLFLKSGWTSATDLFQASQGDVTKILVNLAKSRAYNDPIRKKSYFYLGLVANSNAFELSSLDELGAPVDYHEVRGHLRLGTVTLAPELRSKLLENETVAQPEDVAIRSAVHEAIKLIAHELFISPMRLHYLFWNLFRNICDRKSPSCRIKCDSLPERYQHFSIDGCPFNGECRSINDDTKLLEHAFFTDWY